MIEKVKTETEECFGCFYYKTLICLKPKDQSCGDETGFYHFKEVPNAEKNNQN